MKAWSYSGLLLLLPPAVNTYSWGQKAAFTTGGGGGRQAERRDVQAARGMGHTVADRGGENSEEMRTADKGATGLLVPKGGKGVGYPHPQLGSVSRF